MKKLFLLAPLALASCGLFGIPKGDVTGSITGNAPTGKGTIRLALGSATVEGIQNSNPDQIAIDTFNPAKKVYAISLPSDAKNGAYDVFAYADANDNKKWDIGEIRTNSGKTLVYSADGLGKKDGSNVLNLQPGWTQLSGLSVTKTGKPFTDYNLSW